MTSSTVTLSTQFGALLAPYFTRNSVLTGLVIGSSLKAYTDNNARTTRQGDLAKASYFPSGTLLYFFANMIFELTAEVFSSPYWWAQQAVSTSLNFLKGRDLILIATTEFFVNTLIDQNDQDNNLSRIKSFVGNMVSHVALACGLLLIANNRPYIGLGLLIPNLYNKYIKEHLDRNTARGISLLEPYGRAAYLMTISPHLLGPIALIHTIHSSVFKPIPNRNQPTIF